MRCCGLLCRVLGYTSTTVLLQLQYSVLASPGNMRKPPGSTSRKHVAASLQLIRTQQINFPLDYFVRRMRMYIRAPVIPLTNANHIKNNKILHQNKIYNAH